MPFKLNNNYLAMSIQFRYFYVDNLKIGGNFVKWHLLP